MNSARANFYSGTLPSDWETAPRGTNRTHSPLQTAACRAARIAADSHCPASCGLPHPSLVNIRVKPLVVAPLMCLLELEQALQLVTDNLHNHKSLNTPQHTLHDTRVCTHTQHRWLYTHTKTFGFGFFLCLVLPACPDVSRRGLRDEAASRPGGITLKLYLLFSADEVDVSREITLSWSRTAGPSPSPSCT